MSHLTLEDRSLELWTRGTDGILSHYEVAPEEQLLVPGWSAEPTNLSQCASQMQAGWDKP